MSLRAQQAQLLQDAGFLNQVAGSLVFAALQVVSELSTTPNHTNRVAFANAIFLDPQSQARIIAPGMLSKAAIAAAAPTPAAVLDTDVDATVANLFDIFATRYATTFVVPQSPQLAK